MLQRVTGLAIELIIGISSGWILRGQESGRAIAKVYYRKAKPGKLDDYNRYIKTVGEPVDFEAQRAGAFLSKALDDAGLRVQPDEGKRKANSDLAATLRDPVGHEELEILK